MQRVLLRVLLLAKHGVNLPCILLANFLLTLPFSINLVPIMSLRFLFRRKAKIGGFWNISTRFGFMCRRCQCFTTISFILGSVLLYLGDKGIFVAVSFFFSFKSCSLSPVSSLSCNSNTHKIFSFVCSVFITFISSWTSMSRHYFNIFHCQDILFM